MISIKNAILASCLLSCQVSLASTTIELPTHIPYNPIDPSAPFPSDVQRYFKISQGASNTPLCITPGTDYILSGLLYRGDPNAQDQNHFAALYVPKNTDTRSWCGISLISRTAQLKCGDGPWPVPCDSTTNQQVYCPASGLAQPDFTTCLIIAP